MIGAVIGLFIGFIGWLVLRLMGAIVTVAPNERAVRTSFGKAERIGSAMNNLSNELDEEESERYQYPAVKVLQPGMYFQMPWQKIYKVSIATETIDIGYEPGSSMHSGVLDAVTKDQLNTGITGQIRYFVSENNLYAYLFGVKNPRAHVMGFFHSVLREKIANYEAPEQTSLLDELDDGKESDETKSLMNQRVKGISINDLRKNLRDINDHMEHECRPSAARYGIALEAALITGIDPPDDVESALAAINTAHNQISSEVSVAQAAADQKIVQSKRAVEIEKLKAEAEVEPLLRLAERLTDLKERGGLKSYLRNVRLELFARANNVIMEADKDV